MGKKYLDTKETSLESSILGVWAEAAKKVDETNKNDKSDDGEGLDAVQPKAVKKKFKDRKDKDIDNDGDTDDSDKFLHKKRKAISKAMKDEGNAFGKALKAAKEKGDKTFVVSGKTYEVKESYEIGTNKYRDHTLEVTPGQTDPEWAQARDFKVASMREALAKVWGLDEKKEEYDEEDEELKPVKGSKTMTGGKVAKVDTKPKLEEVDLDEGKMKDLLIKAQKLMGPSKNRKEGIQMVAKGLKVSEKEATKLVDEVIKMKMNEEVDLDEGKMSQLHQYIKDKKSAEEIAKLMKVDVKTIKSLMSSYESHDGDDMKDNGEYMEMLAAACGGGGGGGAIPAGSAH